MSFYSADLYRDVGRNWKGVGLLYLTVLLAICWLPSAGRWAAGLHRFAATVPQTTAELPDITITNGVMQARPPGRHEFREPDSRPGRPGTTFVIDDTIDDVPSDLTSETVMLTRREAGMVRPSRHERRVWRLDAVGDLDVTRQDVIAFLTSLQVWLPPLAYVCCVLGALVFRLLQACLYGSLTQMYAQHRKLTLDFKSALRIAAVAVTPVIVLRTLVWFLPAEPSWYIRWPAAILITAYYLRFAVNALAEEPSVDPAGTIVA